jgi:hypothetical protein
MSFERLTRMISFRVSESEFETLRVRSEEHGSRSISDYARLALRDVPNGGDRDGETSLDQLTSEVRRLSTDVRRLMDLIEGPLRLPMARGHAAGNGDHVDA